MTYEALKALIGDKEEEHSIGLFKDFALYMSFIFFADFCKRQDDPQKAATKLISQWKSRVLSQRDSELKKLDDINSSQSMAVLFGSMMPDKQEIDDTFIKNIDKVIDVLLRIADIL